MVLTRRNKFLQCFYCGRKSSTKYTGQASFECRVCDATNYLDENGDITDPPESAIRESAPSTMTYATSARSSKQSSTIFCDTCLNNQRLFTASLAQYLPDDQDAPDYATREQEYYKFRKRLEKIYPQICADCEPKVRQKLEQAEFNAKADVLRHMIDQTKTNKRVTRRSWLDVVHLIGRWLWMAGFAAEIMSHILAVSALGLEYCRTEETMLWACSLMQALAPPVIGRLPDHGLLLGWSFYAGIMSCWWNPRFVQTVRGLTRNLLGLPNWYIYQVMVVGIRLFATRFLGYGPTTATTRFGIHLLFLAFALIILRFASTSIRVDNTPLFGAKSKMQARRDASRQEHDSRTTSQHPSPSKPDGVKNMSDLLDEILETPAVPRRPPPPTSATRSSFPARSNFGATNSIARKPNLDMQSLNLSPGQNELQQFGQPVSTTSNLTTRTTTDYEEEMDWSPSTSQHRAFSSYRESDSQHQRFNEAPTEEKKGPFWFHVPPAPRSQAARIANPSPKPILRSFQALVPSDAAVFRDSGRNAMTTATPSSVAAVNGDCAEGGIDGSSVAFARPTFFPPPARDDPRDGLAEMLGQGFTLRQTPPDTERSSWLGGLFGGKK